MTLTDDLREEIFLGVEAKITQYEEYAPTHCTDPIDLTSLIGSCLFGKVVEPNYIVINLEKDAERYENTKKELLEKMGVTKFFHLKGTYGKDKQSAEEGLNTVLMYLRKFAPGISTEPVTINEFSEVSDEAVNIQDGPLGCYCSHMRSMIHGYENFEDYTVIIEDDISITDTSIIEKCLSFIPFDWDMVCLNAAPKNRTYPGPWYKLTDAFHSSHFYIVRNSSFPRLFGYCYPIDDQVDVLMANSVDDLNIYNIAYCVYQKNLSTNTQNNLHSLFTSPNYSYLRGELENIKRCIAFFVNKMLPDNEALSDTLVNDILYDIVFEAILGVDHTPHENKESFVLEHAEYADFQEYKELLISLDYFIRSSKKGDDPEEIAFGLLGAILHTIWSFKLHNTVDPSGQKLKAHAFGSSAHIYLSENKDVILKSYNEKLRWITDRHDDAGVIFEREREILRRVQGMDHVPKLLGNDLHSLRMSYCGESLYHDFILPSDWKEQIRETFDGLTQAGVYYPEFRLQNILVLDGKVSFVDFGLAELNSQRSNEDNCLHFTSILDLIDQRFKVEPDLERRRKLLSNLFRNQGRR
jgi:GR25 family glycosyltransferase involved in LPS biosynthesis/tRNA A-37 threonylcarbamoyl transferase component Bud32